MPFIPNPAGGDTAKVYVYDSASSTWTPLSVGESISETLTTTGAGSTFTFNNGYTSHSWQVESDASSTAFTVKLQGSIDGSTWFDLDEYTGTNNTLRHVVNKPAKYIRAYVVDMGDASSITVKYLGVRG